MGEPVQHGNVPPEVFRNFGFPGADDLGNMFQFNRDFEREFRDARNVERTRALYPGLQRFESWLTRNAAKIPRS